MPSTSKAQSRFMAAVAHNPEFAKKAGVSQSVGKDFAAADKGQRYKSLPERKGDGKVAKKKSWLKGDKGAKKLKAKLSEPKKKSEDERMASRYGSDK
jgi:hypothetical protein